MTEAGPVRPTPEGARGPDAAGLWEVEGQATLFGFDAVPVQGSILPRSRGWRIGGAARTMVLFLVIAPLVAVFPPHAVWLIGALITGGVLARKRYVERFTLKALSGACPKCGKAFETKAGRLRLPHPVPCAGCHHEASVRFPGSVLEAIASE
jgi:hypothetical protein